VKWLTVSFVIFILGLLNFFAPVRGSFQYVFNPVQYGIQQMAVGLKSSINFFSGLREIRQENLALLSEREHLKAEIFRLQDLDKENELLRKQLSISMEQNTTDSLVLARVFGNADDKTGTSIMIDRGASAGIAINDVVIKERFLVGIVRAVTPTRSRVELISSPDLSVSVYDFHTNTEGISLGEFGTSLRVSRVLPGEAVSVNDVFVTSGRDGIFPPGYVVGEVSSVSEESADTLKEVTLDSVLDLENLDRVFVITDIQR
jgi:rod shape-determining protein MreC